MQLKLDNGKCTNKLEYKRERYVLEFGEETPFIHVLISPNNDYAVEVETDRGLQRWLTQESALELANNFLIKESIQYKNVEYVGESVYTVRSRDFESYKFKYELTDLVPASLIHEKWQVKCIG